MAKSRFNSNARSITDETTGFRLHQGETVNVKEGQHVAGVNSWEVKQVLGGIHGQIILTKTLAGNDYSWTVPMNHCKPAARDAAMASHPAAWRSKEQLDQEAESLAKATGSVAATVVHETVDNLGIRTERGRGSWKAPTAITYAAGSRLGDVRHFDRGQKVTFRCPQHPEVQWMSKEPACSAWFPATDSMSRCPQTCITAADNYELVLDYVVTPQR